MTTFTDSLVSEMAQNFNKALDGVDPIDLTDDKTLKWRGLLNNKYASASGRRGIINKRARLDTQGSPCSSLTKPIVDKASESIIRQTINVAENINNTDNNSIDTSNDMIICISKNDDKVDQSKRMLRRKAKLQYTATEVNSVIKKDNQDEAAIGVDDVNETVVRVRKGRTKRYSNDIFEPKTLRSRRCDQLQHSVANECEEDKQEKNHFQCLIKEPVTTAESNTNDTSNDQSFGMDIDNQHNKQQSKYEPHEVSNVNIVELSSFMFKSQQQSSDEEETKNVNNLLTTVLECNDLVCKTEKPNEDIKDEQPEVPTISSIRTNIATEKPIQKTKFSQDILFPVASSLNIIVPKKRGRKPGYKKHLKPAPTIIKKSTRFSRDNDSDPAFDPINKLNATSTVADPINAPSQRLSRRIKPTAKILANDELRYGFELQNNARLSLSSENLDTEKSPIKDDKQIILPSAHTEAIFVKDSLPNTTIDQTKEKSILEIENLPRLRAPCPDPVEFINAIKMEKINLHRSPEDNKKMSIKQRKRLLKLKEKHFYKLGLQRSRIDYPNSSHNSTETEEGEEEFLPNTKVIVGRPNVTLRLRANTNTLDRFGNNLISKHRKSKNQESQLSLKTRIYTVIPSAKHKTNIILSTSKNTAHDEHDGKSPQRELSSNIKDTTICLCSKPSKYYIHRTTVNGFCRAIDEIENQFVGCCNEIVGGELLNLLRPSVRVKYSLLCSFHVQRLKAHQSCAGCGIFCTQGTFVMCLNSHLFHKDCATKFILNAPFSMISTDFVCPSLVLRCPHCGIDAPDQEGKITMQSKTVPVFLPYQKQMRKMSRMSIGHHTHASGAMVQLKCGGAIGQKQFLCELEKLIPAGVMDVLLRAKRVVDGCRPDGSLADKYTTKDVFEAISNDNVNRMAEIIASGFDISTKLAEFRSGTSLHLVSSFGSLSMSYLILSRSPSVDFMNNRDSELRSALMCAVMGAKNDIIRMLVQCGADVTLRGPGGMTALHLAAKTGNFTAAQTILDSYRRATSATSFGMFVNAVDDGGWTTIVWAAEIGHSDMVEYLVQCGADLSICDAERNTVLHWAALSDDVATVRPLLLEADLNVQNVNGDTPIHIACRNSNIRMCLMFLAHGASLELQNDLGETAFDGIGDEDGACAKAVQFNMKLRSLARFGEQIIVCQDISKGRETYPIKAIKNRKQTTNPVEQDLMDDNEIPHFIYITSSIILQNNIQIDRRISQMRVCSCIDNCTSFGCQCSEISVQNWYNAEGRLHGSFNFADPAMIFECNDVCGCNKLHCKNRVVQNGQKVALQVVEFGGAKGWGVTAVGDVVRGSFVAEYTGEILTDAEADRRVDDSYFFDLDASEHCIDAHYYGNISRFFNHSCVPNLVPIRVFYDHQDLRFPKVALFAVRDICADEEITFDYGDKFWQNKSILCECGNDVCRFS